MNNWSDSITLVSYDTTKDKDGFENRIPVLIEHVPANFKSVTRKEEEHANNLKYKADVVIEIMKANYSDQETLIDEKNGKTYAIKRTYAKTSELLEMTCSDLTKRS